MTETLRVKAAQVRVGIKDSENIAQRPPPAQEGALKQGVANDNSASPDTAKREPIAEDKTVQAEGRLASAFRSAGEVALRWGRQGLIALDGHRINMATKGLGGVNEEMQRARSEGDSKSEAQYAEIIAGQMSEIERLSMRRMKNAAEVKKYFDNKLELPNSNIKYAERLLSAEKIEERGNKPGLDHQIHLSELKIGTWKQQQQALSAEFSAIVGASQVDAGANAVKASQMAAEMKRLAKSIEDEEGNLDAKKNVARSITNDIALNRAVYSRAYAGLDKYSSIAEDGRTGTEALVLRDRQEAAKNTPEQPPVTSGPSEDNQPPSSATSSAEALRSINTIASPDEFTSEDFLRGLRELVNEDIRASLEKLVTGVGGKAMNETKMKPVEFAKIWNRAREKNTQLPELKTGQIEKLGGENKTLAEFGVILMQNNDGSLSRDALEYGIRGSAEAWLEFTKTSKPK